MKTHPNTQGKIACVNENFRAYIANTVSPAEASLCHREAGEKVRVRKRARDDGKGKESDRTLHLLSLPVSPPPAY